MQFAQLLDLKTETFGNGYVATQNIKAGTKIKPGDYLGIELVPLEKQKNN